MCSPAPVDEVTCWVTTLVTDDELVSVDDVWLVLEVALVTDDVELGELAVVDAVIEANVSLLLANSRMKPHNS